MIRERAALRAGGVGVAAVAVVAWMGLGSCGQPPVPQEPSRTATRTPSPPASSSERPWASQPLTVRTRREAVVDVLHGRRVEDPYRWLEDDASGEVRTWTEAENAVTRRVLDGIPERAAIRAGVEKLVSIGEVFTPEPRKLRSGTWRYFYRRRAGLQNQPVLYARDGLAGADHQVVDPNAMAADGTVSLDWFYPSPDGTKVAYGLSRNGDEESTLRVAVIDPGWRMRELPDEIPRTRYCSLAWLPNGKGFYYTRFPKKGEVPEGEEGYHRAVYLHGLGANVDGDTKIFGQGRDMTESPGVLLSPDGRWLVVVAYQGWSKSELFLRDLRDASGELRPVAVGKEATYSPEVRNDALYVLTNEDAPKGKVVAVDPLHPERERWREVIPPGPDTLDDIDVIGRELVASYLHDATSRVARFSTDGRLLGEVELPTLGQAEVNGAPDGAEAFVHFESFTVKSDVYRVPLRGRDAGRREMWERVEVPLPPDAFIVEQQFARSKDGTKVPYFVVRGRNVPLDGTAAALVTAYGGFNISLLPAFLSGGAVFLDRGGVFVEANLRGGGEYGEAWHRAGMLANKQNVFDDMIAVAEDVKARGISAPDRLGVVGGSNGGLLVGAMLTQRPELFRVAVARVPLMDMLRYQNFLIAKLWVPEYGSSDDVEQFEVLRGYSPYHHVRDGVAYPATLLTAAVSDSRVHPSHARKMAAALQYATSSSEPILLRLESKAGHGAGKPITKQIDEYEDLYSFLMWKLGLVHGSEVRGGRAAGAADER